MALPLLGVSHPPSPSLVRWLLPLAAALCLGGAHLHPAISFLAWPGFALFAYAVVKAPSMTARLFTVVVVCWVSLFVSQLWLSLCIANYMGPVIQADQAPLWISTATWAFATTIETTRRALPVLLGVLLGRYVPVRLWLGPTVLAGEALGEALGFRMGDLLYSQWNNPAILRSVAGVGLPVTGLLACYACAAMGEAVAKGRIWGGVALALPSMAWFLLLPPLPAADHALVGVGAVHMADFNHRPSPQALAPGIDLLVWPEASSRGLYPMDEGPQAQPTVLRELASWSSVEHVVNPQVSVGKHLLNAIGIADRTGAVLNIRGKQALTPWGERPYGGLDPLKVTMIPGKAPPLLEISGFRLIPTLCYEVYAGYLFREGAALGGELIVNIANDRAYGPSTVGIRQAIGVLALRAAETHRPAVRASLWGSSALISSTGEILATSIPDTTGVLRWDGLPARPTPQTVVLSDGAMPSPFECTGEACLELNVQEFQCDRVNPRARTVVVSGHAMPPVYLGVLPERLAESIACLEPELVVLDTCYGFSSPLLKALASRGVQALVVGAHLQLPGKGLHYGPAFFKASDPVARATAVQWLPGTLDTWRVDETQLEKARALVDAWGPDQLKANLQRVHPNLVKVPLGEHGATVLEWVAAERFRRE